MFNFASFNLGRQSQQERDIEFKERELLIAPDPAKDYSRDDAMPLQPQLVNGAKTLNSANLVECVLLPEFLFAVCS